MSTYERTTKLKKQYSKGEEIANASSHAVGIALIIIAGIVLMKKAIDGGDIWVIGSVPLYLLGAFSSYLASTWYHATTNKKRKELLRKFDHGAIYVHIAGTYSPVALVLLREAGYWGWGIFCFVWLCAIVGFILSFTNLKEHSNFETACFVAMGSCILIAFKPLIDIVSPHEMMNIVWWIIAGGVAYIVGALFYSWRKVKYMHSVFHLFCLIGSVCHIMALYYVVGFKLI